MSPVTALAEHVYGSAPQSGLNLTSALTLMGLGVAGLLLFVVLLGALFRAPTVIVDNGGGSGVFGAILFAGLVIGVLFMTLMQNGGAP
ncbi:hypothetical protein ACIB24_13500 [Spongisporangium articulatum]|uniref:Transporter n=1 Tax=Spongisporangium articulatum TaxID=3362603 RepID=A0ABW8APN7_9ACTN